MIDLKKKLEFWGPIDAKILYVSFWFLPTAKLLKEKFGINWPATLVIMQNNRLTFAWEKEKMVPAGRQAIEKWLVSLSARRKILSLYRRQKKLLFSLGQKPKDDLSNWVKKWHRAYIDFFTITLVFETANYGAPEYLKENIKSLVPKNDLDIILATLLAPEKISFHFQNERDLFKLALASKTEFAGKLKTYLEKWHWVKNNYFSCRQLNKKEVLAQLAGISRRQAQEKIKEIDRYAEKIKQKKGQIAQKYNLPEKILRLAKILSGSIWLQDDRKAIIWQANGILDQFNRSAAKHYKILVDDLLYYTAEEWRDLFGQNKETYGASSEVFFVPQKVMGFHPRSKLRGIQPSWNKLIGAKSIEARKKIYALLLENRKIKEIDGIKIKHILEQFKKFDGKETTNQKAITEIKGITVSRRGFITGKVCILHSPREIAKMEKGIILVAPMTSPDFVPAMRLAKAIITDVGGLMSHAAVLSRELNTPCIVNTKIATQVLKDGDLVKVDANKGIIKKII